MSSGKYWDQLDPLPQAPHSITIPPPPVDYSGAPQHRRHERSQSGWSNSITLPPPTRDPEVGEQSTALRPPPFQDRLSKYLADMWPRNQGWAPRREAPLREWPPLAVEKRRRCEGCQTHNDRRRRTMALIAVLVVFLLFLLGNIIFLNVRVMRLSSSSPPPPPSTPTASTNVSNIAMSDVLSPDARECLSQYTLNAPSDPQSFPCSTCLRPLQQVPSSFIETNEGSGQQVTNAIQFCGLRSIFDTANSDAQLGLSNAGWGKDVRFCAWQGVRCDGFGRVSSLQLSFPAVPATIPDELTALTGLTSLQIVGDTNLPAGDLPASFNSLQSLTTLHLESTAINTIPSALLSSLKKLTTLTLLKNTRMSGDMSSGLISLPLMNLVINEQTVPTNPVPALLFSSAGRSLQTLNLSSTSLSGNLPADISGFSSLLELHLDNNALTNPLPAKFPPNLQSLTLTGNSQLAGLVPSDTSFCNLTQLKTCDIRGTGLSTNAPGCGVCQFP